MRGARSSRLLQYLRASMLPALCSTWCRERALFSPGAANGRRTPGAFVVTEPNEPHGLKADEKTVLLAVIAPRP